MGALGCEVLGLGYEVLGLGYEVRAYCTRYLGLGYEVLGLCTHLLAPGYEVLGHGRARVRGNKLGTPTLWGVGPPDPLGQSPGELKENPGLRPFSGKKTLRNEHA